MTIAGDTPDTRNCRFYSRDTPADSGGQANQETVSGSVGLIDSNRIRMLNIQVVYRTEHCFNFSNRLSPRITTTNLTTGSNGARRRQRRGQKRQRSEVRASS